MNGSLNGSLTGSLNGGTSGSVLVTGGRGFIGGFVLQALRTAMPQQAVLLAGRTQPAATFDGLQTVPLDLTAPHLHLPRGVHTVLHLAAEKHDTARMQAVNHAAAVRLVDAAAQAGAHCFVHLSSVGVYGARKHAGSVTTATPHTPQGDYESSKDAGERGVRERCAALGLRCTVLQPSNVVGLAPGRSRPLLGLTRTVARGWFRHLGAREVWVNYIAAEDVAAALVAAVQHAGAEGTWILNTPAPLRSLVGWVADELKLPAPTATLPLWLAGAAAGLGAVAGAVLRRELPLSPARFRELSNTTRYDGSAVLAALGFNYPLGIEAAVRSMVRQYRHEGLV